MRTAGHAVLASGVTVAISLVALLVVPVPFLRSMGIGGMLIPLVSVAVVLTLLPALLTGIGPRIDWPRIRKEGVASRGWIGLGADHRPAPVRRLRRGPADPGRPRGPRVQPQDRAGPASTRWRAAARRTTPWRRCARRAFGDGVLTPIEVLVPAAEADAAGPAPPARSTASAGASRRRGPGRTGARRGRRPPDPGDRRQLEGTQVVDASARPSRARWSVRSSSPARRHGRGLLQRRLRQVPLRAGPHRPDHLRPAGAHLPLDPAADQGGPAQPRLVGGRLRQPWCSSGRWATARS